MIVGKRRITIFVVVILFVTFIYSIELSETGGDMSDPLSLTSHSPIHIIGDSQFTLSNGVVAGDGSVSNPYIIENWSINASQNHGIWIENTNASFIIRNCYIYTGESEQYIYSGIYFNNVKNGNVCNNSLQYSKYGIEVYKSNYNVIINNICDSNDFYGIVLASSSNNLLSNNSCRNSWYGINLYNSSNNKLINNNCSNQMWYGIYLHSSWDNSIVNNTSFDHDWNGIYLWSSSNNMILNNICSNNGWHGISLRDSSDYNIIENNKCFDQDWDGISLGSSTNNIISNNLCYYNGWRGIDLNHYSNINNIENNTCLENGYGIGLKDSHLNIVYNNTCSKNRFGIHIFDDANNNTIKNNIVESNNDAGIYLVDFPENNIIYNNFFNNSKNYRIRYVLKNSWNISKSPGQNIKGGPILGGNFWSNYMGKDTNGDGFGDTKLPYGPGDYLPLTNFIESNYPGISDKTSGILTTGEEFNFEAIAWGNNGIKKVFVEYWFNYDKHRNISMAKISGTDLIGTYSRKIDVPSNAVKLNYILSVMDNIGNWRSISYPTLNVIDNDKPLIEDHSSTMVNTGDNFTFRAIVTDNINISIVQVTYWFNYENYTNITLTSLSGYYQANITISSNATSMQYILSAVDNSNNCEIMPEVYLEVIDDDKPIIKDCSFETPTTGDNYTIKAKINDNINLSIVYLKYWFDSQPPVNISFNGSYLLIVPNNAKELHYIICAIDGNMNLAFIEKNLKVIDNDIPIIEDLSQEFATTGDVFNVTVKVKDNILISEVTIICWINNNKCFNGIMEFIENNYTKSIQLSDKSLELSYQILAKDLSGNVQIFERKLEVRDNDKPTIIDHSSINKKNFNFLIVVQDNIKIHEVIVYCKYNNGTTQKFNLLSQTKIYQYTITISEDTNKLYYTISAVDTSGNWQRTDEKEVEFPKNQTSSPHIWNSIWSIMAIAIILMIILIILIGNYCYYKKRHKMQKSSKIKSNSIKQFPLRMQNKNQNRIQVAQTHIQPTGTTTIKPSQQPTSQTISKSSLSGSISTNQTNILQQEPKTPQLPPVIPETSETTEESAEQTTAKSNQLMDAQL